MKIINKGIKQDLYSILLSKKGSLKKNRDTIVLKEKNVKTIYTYSDRKNLKNDYKVLKKMKKIFYEKKWFK